MKILYRTFTPLSVDGVSLHVSAESDGDELFVSLANASPYGSPIMFTISYNGTTESYSSADFLSCSFVFPYSDSVKTLVLSDAGGLNTVVWQGNYADPTPSVSMTFSGIRQGDATLFSFSYLSPNLYPAHLATELYRRESYGWVKIGSSHGKNPTAAASYSVPVSESAGRRYKLVLTFGAYSSSSAAFDEYIGLSTLETPELTLTEANTPYTPHSFTISVSGADAVCSWAGVTDISFPVDGYSLLRTVNESGSYTEVYRGVSPSYTDRIPASATSVRYRICALSDGVASTPNTGDCIPASPSNVYVGKNGAPLLASAVYVGKNGSVTQASKIAYVG